jgi:hypothetical protein
MSCKIDKFIILSIFIFVVSCVGTVKEADVNNTEFGVGDKTSISYSGIVRANPIAEDKIEIEFEETFSPITHEYFLHINEDVPYKLSLESLKTGQIGYKKYTLKNLLPNTLYKLRVSIMEKNGIESSGENEVVVKTFDNRVSDFGGVVRVSPVTGRSHNSARISWISTAMQGTYESGPFDTTYYEITYMKTSSPLSYINMDLTPGRQVIKLTASPSNNPSYIDIKTLDPETSYYFQVRAIHKLYKDQEEANANYGTPITLNKDSNTSWIEYKTTAANGIYDFDKESIVLKNTPGVSALSSLQVFWSPPEGTFEGYKVFYRKYTAADGLDPELDDKLTIEAMQSYVDASDTSHYQSVAVDQTSVVLTGLDKYSYYQVKVVPCKTVICKIDPDNESDSSIASSMRSLRVEPSLAPFFGVNFVQEPTDANNVDKIKLIFDTPVLSEGYANKLEVHCLDYAQTDSVILTNTPSASTVGNCNNLKFEGAIDIRNTTQITISSVKNINQNPVEDASYCFALTPAIEGPGLETIKLDRSEWVVRCIQPEIKTPKASQFSGFDGSCIVNKDKVTLNWSTPTGGIFNSFRIMGFKKTSEAESFNYYNSISNLGSADPKFINAYKTAGSSTHTFDDMEAGATYLIGILATIDGGTPASVTDDIYSEYNLKAVECKIPYPVATFEEWTRILAIGAKTNGKVPRTNAGKLAQAEAFIYEAINSEGIPYEAQTTGNFNDGFTVASPGNYILSPGNLGGVIPTSFSDSFDGKTDSGISASRSGVVSIAWKNVSLNFGISSFTLQQDHSSRGTRTYGYRVYRSDDNRENWIDITDSSGLIHSGDYNYYVRSNSTMTTEKMSFFTDYSVDNLLMENSGVEKARVYWYRVVPVFKGKELLYTDSSKIEPHNEIKVTLPPPNMALIHRSMANRNLCSEIGKSLDKENNYQCEYNGLGSRPRSLPWRVGESVYDFGSDLLMDRSELGCNFTRGTDTSTPKYANSFYNRGHTNQTVGIRSELADFTGYSTDGSDSDNLPFRGCTQSVSYDSSLTSLYSMIDTVNGQEFDPAKLGTDYDSRQYNDLMYGDCIMNNTLVLPTAKCSDSSRLISRPRFSYPGLPTQEAYSASGYGKDDCSLIDNDRPQFYSGNNSTELGLLDESFINNVTLQAENFAVVYNRNHTASSILSPYGPTGNGILGNSTLGSSYYIQTCFINIAAIGAKPSSGNAKWKSRWVAGNMLFNLKNPEGSSSYIDKTVLETKSNPDLFSSGDLTEYRVPTSSLDNPNRFDDSTKLGRIISSNSAKLPPLVGFNRREANRLCSTYEVEVGFSSNSSYTQLAQPKAKRLIRKGEFIIASAHPEARIEKISGDTTSDTIINIETGIVEGACVSDFSSPSQQSLNYLSASERALSSAKGVTNLSQTFLWTGSSAQDGVGTRHSQKCTSRYGIQDLIGNTHEQTTDALSCDYSLDAIYFGVRNVVSQSVVIDGYKNPASRTNYTRLYGRGSGYTVDVNATITLLGPDLVDPSDDIVLGDDEPIEVWTDSSPISGYCSLVDDNGQRVIDDNNFILPSGNFKTVFNFNGSINSSTVPIVNDVDPGSVDFLRNGDGRFLNTGPVNILPKIANFGDSLALTPRGIVGYDANNQMTGDYFSPITGFPLLCDNTDISTCGGDSDDNTKITTADLKNPSISSYSLENFPIGNSQISHVSLGTTTTNLRSVSSIEAAKDFQTQLVKNIIVNSADLTDLNEKEVVSLEIEAPGVTGAAYSSNRTEFAIPRFSKLGLLNGGSFDEDISGRYGMTLKTERPSSDISDTGYSDVGIRCGVRINE